MFFFASAEAFAFGGVGVMRMHGWDCDWSAENDVIMASRQSFRGSNFPCLPPSKLGCRHGKLQISMYLYVFKLLKNYLEYVIASLALSALKGIRKKYFDAVVSIVFHVEG